MNPSNALTRALNIEPGEGQPLVLLIAHSFFMGIAIVSFFAASSALFLIEFGRETLPYVYIVSAGVSILTGGIYARFEKRLPFSTLLAGTLIFLLVTVYAFRFSLQNVHAHWPIFGLMVWYTLLRAMFNVEFWGLAGRLFDVRQGKRLFGLVGSGEMVASVIGGLLIPLFIRFWGTPNLLLVSAGGLVCCLLILIETTRRFGDRFVQTQQEFQTQKHTGDRARYSDLLKNRYTALISLLQLLVVIVYYFIDFSFLTQAKVHYLNEDELARFFGLFFGLAQAVTLIISTLATGRIIARYGIRVGMRIRPVALTVCTLLLIPLSAGFGPIGILFVLVVATKLLDHVFLRALSTPAFLILYQPLRPERRLATQVAVESIVGPVAGGIAGALLLLFQWLEPTNGLYLSITTFLLLITWMTVSAKVYREYRHTLGEALRTRRLEGTELSLDEGATLDILEARLKSPHPGEIIYALDLLEKIESDNLEIFLIDLLEHPVPEVRRNVLTRIQRTGFEIAFSAVKSRVEQESVPRVRAVALKALCALGEAEVTDYVAPYLEHTNPEIKLGAIVGLLRSGGIDGVLLAGKYLVEMENASDPTERIFVARILNEVGIRTFYRPLLHLLDDDNPDVRKAALAAAGEIRNPRLWPLVLGNLASQMYHTPAASALVTAGESALPVLQSAFSRPGASREFQIRIADVCGRIRGDRAVALLQSWMGTPNKDVRSKVLDALKPCAYRAREGDIIDVRRLIREDAADTAWILAALLDIPETNPAIAILRRSLFEELEQTRKRCFSLLSFIYDPTFILRAQENLRQTFGEQRAYALEVLDTTISRDLRAVLFPLFERLPPAACLAQLRAFFPQQQRSRNNRLHEIITLKNRWVTPWIRSCAIYTAAELSVRECIDAIESNLLDHNALVRETAAWALAELDRTIYNKHLETLRNDLSPQVIRMVEKIETWAEGDPSMLLTIEKVMVLKSVSVFARVPDEVLADLASVMEELEVPEGETIYEKGGSGQTMYIIVDGRIRVHDGEKTFVTLGERDFFGELTSLDPEPHLATVTAVENTRLLGLNGDLLYELMSDHAEVLRGIIRVLCRRLRNKSADEDW